MIETGVQNGAPKYMEWYGAFGLMVTLIWLYLEILRLLGKGAPQISGNNWPWTIIIEKPVLTNRFCGSAWLRGGAASAPAP